MYYGPVNGFSMIDWIEAGSYRVVEERVEPGSMSSKITSAFTSGLLQSKLLNLSEIHFSVYKLRLTHKHTNSE